MRCSTARTLISAAVDGEASDAERAVLERHVRGCAACCAYAEDARGLGERLRHAAVPADPTDLARHVLVDWTGRTRALDAPRHRRVVRLRIALAAAAVLQLVLSAATLLAGGGEGSLHLAREAATVDMAVAVGVLVAAYRPWYAAGLLPVVCVLAIGFGVTAAVDVVVGHAPLLAEAAHLSAVVELLLLWRLVRHQRRALPVGPAPIASR
jgi:predicted anti-sigma-YlaC factor YlaD